MKHRLKGLSFTKSLFSCGLEAKVNVTEAERCKKLNFYVGEKRVRRMLCVMKCFPDKDQKNDVFQSHVKLCLLNFRFYFVLDLHLSFHFSD